MRVVVVERDIARLREHRGDGLHGFKQAPQGLDVPPLIGQAAKRARDRVHVSTAEPLMERPAGREDLVVADDRLDLPEHVVER